MSREILFRGKADGKWFVGDLLHYAGSPQIWVKDKYGGSLNYTVISETVGEYTGLTDKNGKKIFEGDIVEFKHLTTDYIGEVEFNQRTCGFEIWYNTVAGAYGEKATHSINFSQCDKIEVIGNVYDNSELLEVAK